MLSLGLVATLAACSPGTEDNAADGANDACPLTGSGGSSEAVTVGGDIDAQPEISFVGPLEPEETERTVVIEGEGAAVAEGDTVNVDYTILNGGTAEQIESTYEAGPTVQVLIDSESQLLSGLSKSLVCATEGSRVVGVIPPAEAFGAEGQPQFGLEAEQSLVFVADVVSIAAQPLERAEGTEEDAPEDFPAVELAEDGAPTVTIPDEEPPADFQLATLIQGDGEEVGADDTVTVHYTGINWNTGEIFDSSWERGQPASFPTGGVIPGFRDALVGQLVGSQVIAIIPPELGYGPQGGTPDGSIGAEDTIVFVVDILATS
nr:FKBP-type peptidyl-prolyl cis-trans isomerase [Microcella alkalica]